VAFIKVKPEAGQIVVKAAQGAVVVQSGVIDDLREQLEAQDKRIEILERDKQAALWRAAELKAENAKLVERVRTLEAEVLSLQAQLIRESRIAAMERRLTAEEARNTGIEEAAAKESKRQDKSDKRADDTEGHA
jgi:chromosome segregation ATPase